MLKQSSRVMPDPENSVNHRCISQRALRTSFEKQWAERVQFLRGSVPELLRKPIATCGFPGGGGRVSVPELLRKPIAPSFTMGASKTPVHPSGSTYEGCNLKRF